METVITVADKALRYANIQKVELIIIDKIITASKINDIMDIIHENIELNPEDVTDTLLNLCNSLKFDINQYSELINNNEDTSDEWIGSNEREALENTKSLLVYELCNILNTDWTYLKSNTI